MQLSDAQANMRQAYFGGATGLGVSALMWLLAALLAVVHSPRAAVLLLFFGGMLIHPLAIWFSKLLGRTGAHAKGNPLGALALESTGILLLGVLLALALAQLRVQWFFPAMLLVIGGRYLTFQTLYGLSVYWLCGGVLAALGVLTAVLRLPVAAGAMAGGVTELIFAAVVYLKVRHEAAPVAPGGGRAD